MFEFIFKHAISWSWFFFFFFGSSANTKSSPVKLVSKLYFHCFINVFSCLFGCTFLCFTPPAPSGKTKGKTDSQVLYYKKCRLFLFVLWATGWLTSISSIRSCQICASVLGEPASGKLIFKLFLSALPVVLSNCSVNNISSLSLTQIKYIDIPTMGLCKSLDSQIVDFLD